MNSTSKILIFISLIAALVGVAHGLDYLWLTDEELMAFGDQVKWQSGETLDGMVRSNSQFSIMGSPVFLDHLITTESDLWRGAGYSPIFFGPPPSFNAPYFPIPADLRYIRDLARWSNFISPGPDRQLRLVFWGDHIQFYRWDRGLPFDSTDRWSIPISRSGQATVIFCDCPIEVEGMISGRVVIGASGDIGIRDNVYYAGTDLSTGVIPANCPYYLLLSSEKDIKILNTIANGRNNSNGGGRSQPHSDSTSVVITAALYALGGTITFEQQNDLDSGYVCNCPGDAKDERGVIYFTGGLVQRQRGYVHRANLGGTGYLKRMRYDPRLREFPEYVLEDPHTPPSTDTLNFGAVAIGNTITDTAYIFTQIHGALGAVYATSPFSAQRIEPFFGREFRIPVLFAPAQVRQYASPLHINVGNDYREIVLIGRGVASGAPGPITLGSYPNPFNLSTEIKYSLSESGPVKLVLYDVLGREAKKFESLMETAGEHAFLVDASGMASGVYFVRLESNRQFATHKILLVK